MGDSQQKSDEEQVEKKPFKTIKFGVDRIVKHAIPYHLKCLDKHCVNIEKYQEDENWTSVHQEEINASNVVRSLKYDIRELEELNIHVRDEDQEKLLDLIKSPIHEVTEKLSLFLALHSNVMVPMPEFDENLLSLENNIPKIECNLENSSTYEDKPRVNQLQQLQLYEEPTPELKHWGKLKKDIIELNSLFKSLAHSVFSQKKDVDTIEENVQQTTDNVLSGTKHLNKAVILNATLLPLAGAAIGGLLGPVGAAVGFHAFGSLACAITGSALGFGIGCKVKKSRINSCNIEMKAIKESSERLSHSMPDLNLASDDVNGKSLDIETKKNI